MNFSTKTVVTAFVLTASNQQRSCRNRSVAHLLNQNNIAQNYFWKPMAKLQKKLLLLVLITSTFLVEINLVSSRKQAVEAIGILV